MIILILISELMLGCNQSQESTTALEGDEASWTEKQVIDYLYEYLVSKAEQQPEASARANKIIIEWRFRNAVFKANREILDEETLDKLGKSVNMQFGESSLEISTWTGALKKLAKYDVDGFWSLAVDDCGWAVNERTGEVIAQNEEAAQLLREISHQTYRHSIYGYQIEYPAVWTVRQLNEEGKVLIICPEPQVDIAIDKPRKLELGQSLDECASGFATFFSVVYEDFELIDLIRLPNGDYRMEYEWIVGNTRIYSRTYFVLHNSWFFMITGSAPQSNYESYMDEFDYAYDSFGFD